MTCTLAAWVSRHECRHPIGDASEDVAADSSSDAGRTGTAVACVLRPRPHEHRCQELTAGQVAHKLLGKAGLREGGGGADPRSGEGEIGRAHV